MIVINHTCSITKSCTTHLHNVIFYVLTDSGEVMQKTISSYGNHYELDIQGLGSNSFSTKMTG